MKMFNYNSAGSSNRSPPVKTSRPPLLNPTTFPTLPGTPSEGNVKLEITGKNWKPDLAKQDTPVRLSHQVIQARKNREKTDLKDRYNKYMSLFQTTKQKADLAHGDQHKIFTDKAQSYKLEAERIHKILNPSWADMCDDTDDDDDTDQDDYSLGNL